VAAAPNADQLPFQTSAGLIPDICIPPPNFERRGQFVCANDEAIMIPEFAVSLATLFQEECFRKSVSGRMPIE
jgi:hypothetical protein